MAWTIQHGTSSYPNYSWFTIAFTFCLFTGISVALVSDTAQDYRVAIVGFLVAGFILTSSSVNSLIYPSDILRESVVAGFMLLSGVNV